MANRMTIHHRQDDMSGRVFPDITRMIWLAGLSKPSSYHSSPGLSLSILHWSIIPNTATMSSPLKLQISSDNLIFRKELTRSHKIARCELYRRTVVLEDVNGCRIAMDRKLPCWTRPDLIVIKTFTNGYFTFEEAEDIEPMHGLKVEEDFRLGGCVILDQENHTLLPNDWFDNMEASPLDSALERHLSRRTTASDISNTDHHHHLSAATYQRTGASHSMLRLPTEILYNIMRYMAHQELNSFRNTCKRLREISLDSRFNRQFFRSTAPLAEEAEFDANSIELHPVLADIDPWYNTVSKVHLSGRQGTRSYTKIEETSCWKQMATNPPLTKIRIQLGEGELHTINASQGVTVETLVKNLLICIDRMQEEPNGRLWWIGHDRGQIWASPEGDLFYYAWAGFLHKNRDFEGYLVLRPGFENVQYKQ